jgi:preprotein translocase subunit SecG
MIEVVTVVLYTVVVLIALLLIGLILIQQSKGGGFGSAFGGAGDSVFGAHAGTHLTKFTVILISAFFLLVLSLAIITGHREKDKSVVEIEKDILESEDAPAGKTVDAKPAAPAKKKIMLDGKGGEIPVPVPKKKAFETEKDKATGKADTGKKTG